MTSSRPARHPLTPVLCALAATACFSTAARFDSFLHGLFLGMGVALVALALVTVRGTVRGSAQQGWRPTRDEDR